jgi:hypothetical protein
LKNDDIFHLQLFVRHRERAFSLFAWQQPVAKNVQAPKMNSWQKCSLLAVRVVKMMRYSLTFVVIVYCLYLYAAEYRYIQHYYFYFYIELIEVPHQCQLSHHPL